MRISDWSSDVCSSDLRNDILGTNWRSTLPTKSREKSLKDVADRAMKSYQNGIAAYRQRLMEKGMDTILVPTMNQGRSGPHKTTFFLASAEFIAEKINQDQPVITPDDVIIYNRSKKSRAGKEGVSTCRSRS